MSYLFKIIVNSLNINVNNIFYENDYVPKQKYLERKVALFYNCMNLLRVNTRHLNSHNCFCIHSFVLYFFQLIYVKKIRHRHSLDVKDYFQKFSGNYKYLSLTLYKNLKSSCFLKMSLIILNNIIILLICLALKCVI